MQPSPEIGQFTSKASSAGDVFLEIGYVPDYFRIVIDVGGTTSDVYEWWNDDNLSMVPATSGAATSMLKTAGATGVRSKVTTSGQIIEAYAGGDEIAADETTNSDPKHVTLDGVAGSAGHRTAKGVQIPSQIQVASGINLYEAYRLGR